MGHSSYLSELIKKGIICEYIDERIVINVDENKWDNSLKEWFINNRKGISKELAAKFIKESEALV